MIQNLFWPCAHVDSTAYQDKTHYLRYYFFPFTTLLNFMILVFQ